MLKGQQKYHCVMLTGISSDVSILLSCTMQVLFYVTLNKQIPLCRSTCSVCEHIFRNLHQHLCVCSFCGEDLYKLLFVTSQKETILGGLLKHTFLSLPTLILVFIFTLNAELSGHLWMTSSCSCRQIRTDVVSSPSVCLAANFYKDSNYYENLDVLLL